MSYRSHADIGGHVVSDPVVPESEQDVFHNEWEPRVLALTLAMGATGSWNIDASRAARETLPDYATLSYYQIWLAALERLLHERHLVEADELAEGRMIHPPLPVARVLHADAVAATLARGSPTTRPAASLPLFSIGDAVMTRAVEVPHHSRVPGYVRGKIGLIERVHGCHVFAETHAHGLGEQPQWLYTVVFDGAEVWGAGSAAGLSLSIDAWENTLQPA